MAHGILHLLGYDHYDDRSRIKIKLTVDIIKNLNLDYKKAKISLELRNEEKVLYRKWRPLTFNEVVGQEHVTKLYKFIEHKQTSHAYLFTGPRGVGKQQWQEFWQKQSTA